MSKRVFKYPLGAQMPRNHKFLHADMQDSQCVAWLEVDPEKDCDEFCNSPYVLIPTGHEPIPEGAVHKTTFISRGNGTVWHVYDKRGSPAFINKGDSEATFVASSRDSCFACGGSGHAEDVRGCWYNAEGINRHVRELDVLLNGEDGAAIQAMLIDLVAQVRSVLLATGRSKLL